jgi:Rieske Fe-S protein
VSNVGNTALANVGSAALVRAGSNSILVTRTAQDSFTAVTAICTHEQCEITGFQSNTFFCPCHGSQYNTSGAVRQGPATRALQGFNTQFTNNVLTITV